MRLLLGNEALAFGAMDGGARFYAGHPLQASAEIDRALLSALPERGGTAVLVEDEAAALAATLGAGAGGLLGVTATNAAGLAMAGPLLEHAAAHGIPALLAVVGSPDEARPAGEPAGATGAPAGGSIPGFRRLETASQREFGPLRWCASGGDSLPVYAPASAGECYSLARAAAREAVARRGPVVLYVDHVIGHLREPVDDAAAPEAAPEPAESFRVRDAVTLVVAVGIVARAARSAVRLARERGVRAGLFRPVRLWPFPAPALREAASGVERVIVAELNEGQLVEPVAAAIAGLTPLPPVRSLTGVGMLEPDRIAAALEETA